MVLHRHQALQTNSESDDHFGHQVEKVPPHPTVAKDTFALVPRGAT